MKAILEFDLNDAGDAHEHKLMLKATAMACVLHDMLNSMRSAYKHANPEPSTTMEEAERWRGVLISMMEENGVHVEDLE
jgi:hypothetical protein